MLALILFSLLCQISGQILTIILPCIKVKSFDVRTWGVTRSSRTVLEGFFWDFSYTSVVTDDSGK